MPDSQPVPLTNSSPRIVSFCTTCSVDQFYPEIGESTLRVLQKAGTQVIYPKAQTCCGQTAFNSGFWNEARQIARRFIGVFDGDIPILFPSGSCAAMVRIFYEDLFHDDPSVLREVRNIAARVVELSEYLVDVVGVDNLSFTAPNDCSIGDVTYHEACHLRRELGATTQARDLIVAAGGMQLIEMEQSEVCCGFGGTFSVKYPDISGAMLDDKIANIVKTGATSVVSCDSTCLMQIKGGLDRQGIDINTMHLAQLLDRAMGL